MLKLTKSQDQNTSDLCNRQRRRIRILHVLYVHEDTYRMERKTCWIRKKRTKWKNSEEDQFSKSYAQFKKVRSDYYKKKC